MALVRSAAARLLRSNQLKTTTRIVTPPNAIKTVGSISDVLVQKRGIHTAGDPEMIDEVRKQIHDNPDPSDCLSRNLIRWFFDTRVLEFATSKSLLGNTFTLIQLVLLDPERYIEEHQYEFDSAPIDAPDAAECYRNFFKAVIPCLLHAYDTDCWVFSRSLVFTEYSLINEAPKFTTHDPVGGLRDIQFDIPHGITADMDQVMENYSSLLDKAVKEFRHELFERPFIRCTEAFLVIVGEYAVEDGRLNSREGVRKLLHELNSKDGLAKVHAFEVFFGSAKVNPETLSAIRDVHITV